jgi:PEP-CTERM motif
MRLSSLLTLALLAAPTLTHADTVLVGTNLSTASGGTSLCPSGSDCNDLANQFTLSTAVVIDSISVVVTTGNFPSVTKGDFTSFTIGLGSQITGGVTSGIGAGDIPANPDGTLNTEEFTFSGLDLSLAAGTYYLGMAGGNVDWDRAQPLSTSADAVGQQFLCDPTDAFMACSNPLNWNSLSGSSEFAFEIDGTTVPVATPEPSTFALLGTGVLGLAGVVRRRVLSQV